MTELAMSIIAFVIVTITTGAVSPRPTRTLNSSDTENTAAPEGRNLAAITDAGAIDFDT